MKGIVLAGGTGSRLYPLTKVTNKHLLPVGRKPMIYHPIEKLAGAGITEILVVTGTEHMGDVVGLLGSGKEFSIRITYKVQDEAGGIAQALSLAENFAGGSPVAVILGDNIFEDPLGPMVQSFEERQRGRGARIALKEVQDPARFGVATLQGDRVVKIVEKPKEPESHWAVTGIYLYDAEVYNVIRTLRPSGRGELEITDVNNAYIARGEMGYDFLKGWWTDAGTFESLATASRNVGEN
jgi:glucose-1-phosphate thymidylyltransferase